MSPLLTVFSYAVNYRLNFIFVFSHIKCCPWYRKHCNCCYFYWIFCPPCRMVISSAKQSCYCLDIIIITIFVFLCENFIMYIVIIVFNCSYFCCVHVNSKIPDSFIANCFSPKNKRRPRVNWFRWWFLVVTTWKSTFFIYHFTIFIKFIVGNSRCPWMSFIYVKIS